MKKITPSFYKVFQVMLVAFMLILIMYVDVDAQCAMCKMSGETNLKDGGKAAAGLNQGIIYLLIFPYILVGTVAFLWWRNRKLVREQEMEEELKALLEPHEIVIAGEEFHEVD